MNLAEKVKVIILKSETMSEEAKLKYSNTPKPRYKAKSLN